MPADRGPILKQCCCGCSLKVGAIIIGVLYLVGSLIELGTAWYNATHPDVHRDPNFQKNLNLLSEYTGEDSRIFVQVEDSYGGRYFIAQAVFAGIQALAGVLLLVGTGQERSGLILPWLIVEAIVMIVHGILFVGLSVLAFTHENPMAGGIFIVTLLVYAALSIYFYLVVYSFYQTLRARTNVHMV